MTDFADHLDGAAARILEALNDAAQPRTAWELKLRLKVPISELYLALGALAGQGRVRVTPDGLTYRVQTVSSNGSVPAGAAGKEYDLSRGAGRIPRARSNSSSVVPAADMPQVPPPGAAPTPPGS